MGKQRPYRRCTGVGKDHRSRQPCYRSVTCCRSPFRYAITLTCQAPVCREQDLQSDAAGMRWLTYTLWIVPRPDHEFNKRQPRYHSISLHFQPRLFTVTLFLCTLGDPSVLVHCLPIRIDQSNILNLGHSVLGQPPRLLAIACQDITSPPRNTGRDISYLPEESLPFSYLAVRRLSNGKYSTIHNGRRPG